MNRYVVVGAGAVGGAIGGLLHQAGAPVTLVARGPHLDALRRDGLTLATPAQTCRLAVDAVASPAEARIAAEDVVLLGTKLHDVRAAMAALAPFLSADNVVLCAQNGVYAEELAREATALAAPPILGMVVFAPVAHLEPGRVVCHGAPTPGILEVGVHPRGAAAPAPSIVRDLRAAGFDARLEPDITRRKYGKLLLNLGNAVQALCGAVPFDHPLLAGLVAEAVACLEAAGIDYAPLEESRARYSGVREVPVEGRARPGGSTWQSLQRGLGVVETAHLNGVVVSLGRRCGVPTPLNGMLVALAERAAAERRAPGATSLSELEVR